MIEVECLERMVVEIMRKEEDVLNIEKIKESDEKNTSTMAAGSTSTTKHMRKITNDAKSFAIGKRALAALAPS
ncbi:hypothetical protein Tco_1101049 [Tanacetum coccineum]